MFGKKSKKATLKRTLLLLMFYVSGMLLGVPLGMFETTTQFFLVLVGGSVTLVFLKILETVKG